MKMTKVLILNPPNSHYTKRMADVVANGTHQLDSVDVRLKSICLDDQMDGLFWHQVSAHYGATSAGAAEEYRVQVACRRLGRRLSEWTAGMIKGRKEAAPLNQTYERFQDFGK